jgi:hypothetical protein
MTNRILYLVTALSGGAVWLAVSMISGKLEAWDSALYFQAGMPILFAVTGVAGFLSPGRPYRWGLSVVALQPAIMLLRSPEMGGLIVMGLFVFLIYGGLLTIGAALGGWIKKRFAAG